MTTLNYDIVIVGAGPAGSSAAYTLSKFGVSTLLIDKAIFPRNKLCGGLLTERCKTNFEKVFKSGWEQASLIKSDDIIFYNNLEKLVRISKTQHGTSLFFTDRIHFDNYLVSRLSSTSVDTRFGANISEIDLNRKDLTLSTGEHIIYKYIIAADGVNSFLAKKLFGKSFEENLIGFGMEVEVPRSQLKLDDNIIEIDFAAAKWGYGWAFPKKNNYTIGVGGLYRKNKNFRQLLSEYLMKFGIDGTHLKYKGQYIPFGRVRHPVALRSVFFIGDAAGAVDPITGEGIAYAIETGRLAAENIANSIKNNNSITETEALYIQSFGRIVKSISQANKWRFIIFPSWIFNCFTWAFKDASTLQNWYMNLLAGKNEYSDLPFVFIKQFFKGLRKIFIYLPITLLLQYFNVLKKFLYHCFKLLK